MVNAAATREISPDVTSELDKTGMTASLLCAVHCAVMPMIITLLPLLGLGFLANDWLEWGFVGISAALGVASLCMGFRTHRSRRALWILGAGLALLVLGRIAEKNHMGVMGVPVVVAGGCTVAASHFLNRKMCASCHRCHPDSH